MKPITPSSNTADSSYLSEAEHFVRDRLVPCMLHNELDAMRETLSWAEDAGLDWKKIYLRATELLSSADRPGFPRLDEVDPSRRSTKTLKFHTAEEKESYEHSRRGIIDVLKRLESGLDLVEAIEGREK
jgi:hypothetical protein